MKTLSLSVLSVLAALVVLPAASATERKWKELPLLTTSERTYWPLTPKEREKMRMTPGAPSSPPTWTVQYFPTHPTPPVLKNPFPEIFRYWVWISRHPDWEPVGIVFRPDEDFPIADGSYLKFDVRNLAGPTLPMRIVGQSLSTASERFVLVSARVEKRDIDEFKARGTQVETVEKYRRELAKQGIAVVELRADTYAMIETAEPRRAFPHDRSRAAEFERDREAWFNERPRYEPRGLIYQPTTPAGGVPAEFQVEGDRVRHLAAALAKFTQKELFVQAAVEKEKFKAPVLTGSRDEIMKQLARYMDHADVKLVEIGPEELALIEE